MTRAFRRAVATVTAAVALVVLSCAIVPDASAQRPSRIYMITWRGITDAERGFQNYMAERNIPVEYIMRDANQDPAKLVEFVDEIRRMKPDLVYTWGTPTTLGVVGRYDDPHPEKFIRDIPVVFTIVAYPVSAKIVPDLSSSRRNVTGVYHVATTESILSGIMSYRKFTKLGILYNKAEKNSEAFVQEVRTLAKKMGFRLLERKFRLGPDGKPIADGAEELVQELKGDGAEWLLIGPDSYFASILTTMAPAIRKARLPAFAITEPAAMAPEGILAGLVSKFYSIGQFTGYKAEQILIGKKAASSIPVETLKRYSFIVRIEAAKELKLYPPVSMFNYAEIIN